MRADRILLRRTDLRLPAQECIVILRKEPDREGSPDAADTVDRDRTDRVVDLHLVEEIHRVDNDDASDASNEGGWEWVNRSTRSGDRNESREGTVANHGDVRLAGLEPMVAAENNPPARLRASC